MNTSFTPGGWAIDESKAYNNLVVSSTVTGDAVCEVLCEPDSDPIGEANARLIAAAPALFEALTEIISECRGPIPDNARAAINLATGQEP